MLQLVQALRYEDTHESKLSGASRSLVTIDVLPRQADTETDFIFRKSVEDMNIRNFMYWYLKVEKEDPKYGPLYDKKFSEFRRRLMALEGGAYSHLPRLTRCRRTEQDAESVDTSTGRQHAGRVESGETIELIHLNKFKVSMKCERETGGQRIESREEQKRETAEIPRHHAAHGKSRKSRGFQEEITSSTRSCCDHRRHRTQYVSTLLSSFAFFVYSSSLFIHIPLFIHLLSYSYSSSSIPSSIGLLSSHDTKHHII